MERIRGGDEILVLCTSQTCKKMLALNIKQAQLQCKVFSRL